jgi:hypothetical protein
MTKIIIESENIQLQDKELRELFDKVCTKILTLNERTKRQTIQIRDLEKRIKLLEGNNET